MYILCKYGIQAKKWKNLICENAEEWSTYQFRKETQRCGIQQKMKIKKTKTAR